MSALSVRPRLAPAGPASGGPVARALASAAMEGGVMAEPPCRFHLVPGAGGQWVVVSCPPPRDAAHAAFVHERSLTAVQRFTLSLWSDGVVAVWEPAPLPTAALDGLALDADWAIGRVWCPDPA